MQALVRDGSRTVSELYTPKTFRELLGKEEVKAVELVEGMEVMVEGAYYVVIASRPNGKITLKRIKHA